MKSNNDHTSTGMWIVECCEAFETFESKYLVFQHLSDMIEKFESGRITVDEDTGERSWFSKYILGMNPRIVKMHFAMEWYNETASLFFFDDADSEYRVKDVEYPIKPDEETRKKISHGELKPHPLEECLSIQRALKAVEEYLETGIRPIWLKYEYVA